jgi:hypothetical protein
MISLKEFLEIFEKSKDINIPEEQLIKFYKSIKKSLILLYAGSRAKPLLEKLEKESQWPVLEKIDDVKMDIYKGADPVLLRTFVNSIKDEKEIRSSGKKFGHQDDWIILRIKIITRTELYKNIFNLTEKEIASCERAGKKFEKILIKKRNGRLLKWSATGIAVAGIIGTTYYFTTKKTPTLK